MLNISVDTNLDSCIDTWKEYIYFNGIIHINSSIGASVKNSNGLNASTLGNKAGTG